MELQEFYDEVARLLETEHEYTKPQPVHGHGWVRHDGTIRNTYKTRWNGREPGNGRFPDHGIVRVFRDDYIHVVLTDPPLSGQYSSLADVLDAIARAIGEKLTKQAHAEIDNLLKDKPDRWIDRYREKVREANEAARQVVRAAGVTIHPRIAAARAAKEDKTSDTENS